MFKEVLVRYPYRWNIASSSSYYRIWHSRNSLSRLRYHLKNLAIRILYNSPLITYIVKSIKKQKGKPSEMDLPFLKNDITDFFPAPELKIHSKYLHAKQAKARPFLTLPFKE